MYCFLPKFLHLFTFPDAVEKGALMSFTFHTVSEMSGLNLFSFTGNGNVGPHYPILLLYQFKSRIN